MTAELSKPVPGIRYCRDVGGDGSVRSASALAIPPWYSCMSSPRCDGWLCCFCGLEVVWGQGALEIKSHEEVRHTLLFVT